MSNVCRFPPILRCSALEIPVNHTSGTAINRLLRCMQEYYPAIRRDNQKGDPVMAHITVKEFLKKKFLLFQIYSK